MSNIITNEEINFLLRGEKKTEIEQKETNNISVKLVKSSNNSRYSSAKEESRVYEIIENGKIWEFSFYTNQSTYLRNDNYYFTCKIHDKEGKFDYSTRGQEPSYLKILERVHDDMGQSTKEEQVIKLAIPLIIKEEQLLLNQRKIANQLGIKNISDLRMKEILAGREKE